MVDIKPPILTKRVKDISTFYNIIKKDNDKATPKVIFEFIENNGDVCIQTLDMFRENFKHNVYLTVLPFYLKKKKDTKKSDKDDIKFDFEKHIQYMDMWISEMKQGEKQEREATTVVLLDEALADLQKLDI